MATTLSVPQDPDDLLASLIPSSSFALAPSPPPPPPAPRRVVAPAAPKPAANDPANDVFAQRLAALDAARRGAPGGDPATAQVAHAAQVQTDYAKARAQAQAGITQGNASIKKFSDAVNTVADPARKFMSNLGLGIIGDAILPDRDPGRQVTAMGAGGGGPLIGMATGGLAAAENAFENMGRRARGETPVDTNAVYRGYRDAQDQNTTQIRGDYPVTSTMGAIGGIKGLGIPLKAGGELLAGLPGMEAAADAIKSWGPIAAAAKQAKGIKLAGQLALKPGVMDWLTNAGETALSAIPGAAAYSGLSGHTLGEHAENAAKGALWGGGVGLGLGLGAPVLSALGNTAKDVGGYLKGLATKEPEEGLITPADMEAAKQTVADLARQAGVQSSNVAGKSAPFSDAVAGQLLGVQGQNLTGSLTRRKGTTGDAMRALQFQRAQGRPDELKTATANILGVDPDEARSMLEGIVQKGRDEAGPLYDAIGDSPHGVNSPPLDRLLKSKTGQTVLGHVNEMAKLGNVQPEGLTWAEMEKPPPPGAPESVAPDEAPMVGNKIIQPGEAPPELPPAPEVKVPRGPSAPPSQGMPLHTWLARQGGVAGPDMGEAMARDIGKIGARSKQNAQLVEELAMRARDAGYFPAYQDPPTNSEFLDAVMNSQSKPHYPTYGTGQGAVAVKAGERFAAKDAAEAQNWTMQGRQAEAQVQSDEAFRAQQAKDAEEHAAWQKHMDEIGDDYGSLEPPGGAAPAEGYPGQPAPETEPVPTTGLTPKSLVLLHQLSQPDYEMGVLKAGDANKQRDMFHRSLGQLLLGHPDTGEGALLPQYKAPLEVAQRYKATQGAYNDGRGMLLNGSDETFAAYLNGLKDKTGALDPNKLAGAQLRASQDVFELAYKGALRGGKFSAPGVEDKLGKLFSPEQAQQMVAKMSAAAEQAAAESRMAPFSNSSSAAMLQAGRETDEGSGHIMDAATAAAKHGMTGVIGDTLKKAWAYRLSQGTSVGYRNALGQLMLMKPAEFEAFLKEMESKPAPAPKPSLAKPIGSAAGATVGQLTAPRF